MKKTLLITALLLTFAVAANAQRHTPGVSGIEINGGIVPSENKIGLSGNIAYLRYLGTKSTLKVEGQYFQFTKTVNNKDFKIHNYGGGLSFYYTLVSDRKNIFFNVGLGGYAGYEDIGKLATKAWQEEQITLNTKSKFVAIPYASAELEFFLFGKTAIILSAKELYSPMSDMKSWHFIASVGIRQLIF